MDRKTIINKTFAAGMLMLAVIMVLATGCGKNAKSLYTPTSSGLPYELLVVATDDVWNSEGGEAVREVLKSDIPGLPQSEASFHVMRVIPENYDNVMKLLRNIVVVKVSDDYREAKMKYAENQYSIPQLILTIQAPDVMSLKEFVLEKQDFILNFFNSAELSRQAEELRKNHSDTIAKWTAEKFNYDICVPYDLQNFKKGENFLWSSSENPIGPLNFMTYSYPYTSQDVFTLDGFVAKRDSVLKVNMPGAFPDSYMTTDARAVFAKEVEINGSYVLEVRGLWKMKGDMMGGPFISHSRVDTLNNRVVTTEVFVYAPEKMKRRYIKKLESSLQTFSFLNNVVEADVKADEAGTK